MNDVFGSTMNRFSLCLLPLLLLTAGCLSSIDDEDYKPLTNDKWREMVKDNENRLKPEEQRRLNTLLRSLILEIEDRGELASLHGSGADQSEE